MSGVYPSTPAFRGIRFASRYFAVASTSLSGRTQGRYLGGHRFEFTARYSPLSAAQFAPVFAFLMRQQGMAETFTIVLPVIGEASAQARGPCTVNRPAPLGASTVAVSGHTGTLKAGDLLVFANHPKAYMITADRPGPGLLALQPALMSAVPRGTAITYDQVPITVRQRGDVQRVDVAPGELFSAEVDLIEAP